MDPAVLLVNRSARRAGTGAWLDAVTSELAQRFALEVRYPRDVADSLSTARSASAAGAVVIVGGGDGTVGIVAHALAGTGGTLGILPLGTANDLARELGVPGDVRASARAIARGTVHPTDLVSVNGRHFATVGGLGLVSRSTTDVARLRAGPASGLVRIAGASIYRIAATVGMLRRRVTGGVRVSWHDPDDDVEHERVLDIHGLFITNHRTCGGGLVIPTGARADDGIFELALVPATNRARLVGRFARLSAGMTLGPDALLVLRADRAEIETEYADVFVADGDPLATGHRFTVAAHRSAVGIVR